jgi:predicted nucleic acid-binding protein
VSALVIDSSAALSWCFEDEASPESDVLFERVCDQGAVVPGLWHLEVANVLPQAEKRGRITTGDVAMRLELIAELPITTDNETTARAWREIFGARERRRTDDLRCDIFGACDPPRSCAADQG